MTKNKNENYKPLVSIIMSCFNGEKYLSKALESIIDQEYQNWELIFWDNQSNDNSSIIFKKYDDERFKYFYAESHTYVSEARTKAIKNANGEILAFLDVDDWWEKDKLSNQIELFNDNKIGLVYSNYYLYNEITKKTEICHKYKLPSGNVLINLLQKYVVGLLTITIKKKYYDQLDYKFHKDLVIMGDMDLVIRLSSICKFGVIQKPLATYRYHNNNFSILNRQMHLKEIDIWFSIMKNYKTISSNQNYHLIKKLYSKMKIIHYIVTNKRIKAFKFFFANKLTHKDRIKLSIALFLPAFVINRIRNK